MKVVINGCHGGFSLSEAGIIRYAEIKGFPVWPIEDEQHARLGSRWPRTFSLVPPDQRAPMLEGKAWSAASMEERIAANKLYDEQTLNAREIPRDDPALVRVVEEMGAAADGMCAQLRVVEIPDGVEWGIEEYDGREWIAETHRTWS